MIRKKDLQDKIDLLSEQLLDITEDFKSIKQKQEQMNNELDIYKRILKYAKGNKPTAYLVKHLCLWGRISPDEWHYTLYVYVNNTECQIDDMHLPSDININPIAVSVYGTDNVKVVFNSESEGEIEVIVTYKTGNYVVNKRKSEVIEDV